MKMSNVVLVMAFGALGLAACDKKSPEQVQKDVTSAEMKGQENVAHEQDKADKVAQDAGKNIQDANADVALVAAKADYKIAVAACEAQSGSARDVCKSNAQAALDTAQAKVDANKPK